MERYMVKRLSKLVVIFTLFIPLFSCSLTPNAMVSLDISTISYEKAIRWGDFSKAKSFHKKSPELSDLERRRLKFYRVTDYATLQTSTPDEFNSFALVEIKYYKNDRPVIKAFTVKQHWKRDEDSEIWYLDSSFPKFR